MWCISDYCKLLDCLPPYFLLRPRISGAREKLVHNALRIELHGESLRKLLSMK